MFYLHWLTFLWWTHFSLCSKNVLLVSTIFTKYFCILSSIMTFRKHFYCTNLIFGASNIGTDSAFLLFAVHFPFPSALVGAHRWHVHGGRSLILWRRRQHSTRLDTVTACASEREGAGVCRGFNIFLLFLQGILWVLFLGTLYSTV